MNYYTLFLFFEIYAKIYYFKSINGKIHKKLMTAKKNNWNKKPLSMNWCKCLHFLFLTPRIIFHKKKC